MVGEPVLKNPTVALALCGVDRRQTEVVSVSAIALAFCLCKRFCVPGFGTDAE